MDASSKAALGPLDVSQRAAKMTTHDGDVIGATVGETPLGVGPDGFVGVELRGVGRKEFEMQSRKSSTDFPNPFSFVNAGVVPDHDDVPAEVVQQVSEKFAHLIVPDVLRVALEVQADAPTPGRNGEAGDHGNAIMPVAMMNDGRLPTGRPGLSHRGDQEEARLVDEDDVGTQPRSVFFTRGQLLRFQRSIFSSSRSRARRSGF
jgi:hypothetical protein